MKRMLFVWVFAMGLTPAFAQKEPQKEKKDTIATERWVIVVERNKNNEKSDTIRILPGNKKGKKKSDMDIGGLDLGYSNYFDNTNYNRAIQQGDVATGVGPEDLQLKLGRSWNVNLWFYMDRVNLLKKNLQLQYAVGLELNNYSFESRNTYLSKNPFYVYTSTTEHKKAKLAADYLTVPVLLKWNLTPKRNKHPLTLGAGVSGGFLYSARFKTKIDGDVSKIKSAFEMDRFKFSYLGELGLGPITIYASVAMRDVFRNELNMTPYTIGLRFLD